MQGFTPAVYSLADFVFPKFKSCLISINLMKIQPGLAAIAAILMYQAYNLQILK